VDADSSRRHDLPLSSLNPLHGVASRKLMEAHVDVVWQMIHERLQNEIRRIHDEIRQYPAPIPACDAQFNYLLEKRETLSSELSQAREFMNESTDGKGRRRSIVEFLNLSACLDDAIKSEIRALIDNANLSREGDQ
jgi:chromosome segregation ATPase